MAQLVENLPSIQEALDSIPCTIQNRVVAQARGLSKRMEVQAILFVYMGSSIKASPAWMNEILPQETKKSLN